MGKLTYLVIHCTATPKGQEVTKADIIHWHTAPKRLGGRGWQRPGYSDMIYLDGSLINVLAFDQNDLVDSWEISNGVRGINGISRHLVYVGGLDKKGKRGKDTRTDAQKGTLLAYVKFTLLRHPDIQILGHQHAPNARKTCPSFDVPRWLKSIGVADKNIYKQP